MIVGVGIDVVDIARFAESLERTPGLLARLFTPTEQRLSASSLAARFAAKEALAKALGAPAGMHWADAEVVTDEAGRPSLTFEGTVLTQVQRLAVAHTHVSLSHDAGIASAVVVLES